MPSPATTETPIERDWTPEYRARKAALTSDEVRRSLELAEEAISVDPFHRAARLDLGNAVIDLNEPGLLVAFRVERGGTILFVACRDHWNR